jgi:hypothetical protein
MKNCFKTTLFLFSVWMIAGCADDLVLVNKTAYPAKNQASKMAVQWASSAKELDDGNRALLHSEPLDAQSLQYLSQKGKIQLNIPENAEYFRVLVWSTGQDEPDYHTNWVDVTANKTYMLKPDNLVPTVLMFGFGC